MASRVVPFRPPAELWQELDDRLRRQARTLMQQLVTGPFDLASWSIVPGPRRIRPPFNSIALRDIVECSPETASRALLSIAGTSARAAAEADWWSWVCVWKTEQAEIALHMTLFDTDPPTWGGFTLAGDASPADLDRLYSLLRVELPGSWLHNAEGELHTSDSFREAFVGAEP